MHSNDTTNAKETQARPCPECKGRGYTVERWPDPAGGPDYVLRPTCRDCKGKEKDA